MEHNMNKSHKHKEKKIYRMILFIYYSKRPNVSIVLGSCWCYPGEAGVEREMKGPLWYGSALFLGLGAAYMDMLTFEKFT